MRSPPGVGDPRLPEISYKPIDLLQLCFSQGDFENRLKARNLELEEHLPSGRTLVDPTHDSPFLVEVHFSRRKWRGVYTDDCIQGLIICPHVEERHNLRHVYSPQSWPWED